MRIDRLIVRNFKGFPEREFNFHPAMNLIIGINGTGKTSALDALAVAAGSWFLGVRGQSNRGIRANEVALGDFEREEIDETGQRHFSVQWDQVYPCEVQAQGVVQGQRVGWKRALNGPGRRTTYSEAADIKRIAADADSAVRSGEDIVLPLISYYGTGRLWQEPRDSFQVSDPVKVASKEDQSRFAGYRNSVDPRLSVVELTRWIARQSWIAYQQNRRESPIFKTVKQAMIGCVEDAQNLYFDANLGEVIVELANGTQPLSNLSDGQRCMLAMVGDIAQKSAKLNPQLGASALRETPGIVLIDELDLHLHPRWQRRVIEDLRRTFPAIQFICSTHSPFLIQSLRSGEELIMLDGQPTADLGNLSIDDIAQGIQHVEAPQTSLRYEEMKGVATQFLETLSEAAIAPPEKLKAFKERLAASIEPYADNPAFQAFLEMKRVAKLGE
jgi:predicted ATP-binding protein involved in virulence